MVIWQPIMKRSWNPHHTQSVLFLTNPVIAAHEPGETAYTDAQAELKLHELLHDPHCLVQRTNRSYSSERVILAARKMPDESKLEIRKVPVACADVEEVQNLNHKVHYSPDGVNFWMWQHTTRHNKVNVYAWDTAKLENNQLHLIRQIVNSNTALSKSMDASDVLLNLYEFEVSYTSSLGNVLSGKA